MKIKEFISQEQIKDFYTTTIEMLQSQGFEIYFLADNRDITYSNIRSKMQSIREEGILSPLHLTPASMAIKQGLRVIDRNGSEVSAEQAEKGFIIKDGNNRYKAIMRLREKLTEAGRGADPIHCMIDVRECDILKTTISMNNHSVKWDAKDYTKAALGQNPESEALNLINDLQKKGFPNTSISMYLCFNEKLTKELPKAVYDIKSIESICVVQRASSLLTTLTDIGYNEKSIKKKSLIAGIVALHNKGIVFPYILRGLRQMTPDEVKFSMDNNNNLDSLEKYLNA